MLFKIIYYLIAYFIVAYALWTYCNFTLTSKYSLNRNFFHYCIFFLFIFLSSFFDNTYLFICIFFILTSIIINISYNNNMYIRFFHSFILTITYILIIPFSITLTDGKTLSNQIMTALLFFIISYFISHTFFVNDIINENTISGYIFVSIPLLSLLIADILSVIYFQNNTSDTDNIEKKIFLIACVLLLITINVIIGELCIHLRTISKQYTQTQLELENAYHISEYYKMLTQQNSERDIFIHDIKRHLYNIANYNNSGNNKKTSEYIETLIGSDALKSTLKVSGNELLNAILAHYYSLCKKAHISFNINVRNSSLSFLTDFDCTSLIDNLLDNAYEAAVKVHNKKAYIDFTIAMVENSSYIAIKVINSCLFNPFDSNGNLSTTKTDGSVHGIGLKSIHRIVKKYNGHIQQYYKQEDDTFHTIITIAPLDK